MPVAAPTTKTRILDAAERCFAEAGFAATSLRMITSAAGANLAAVNYHFGSKQTLFAAVLRRRVEPLNAERLRGLDAIEQSIKSGRLPVEAVLEVFFRPALQLARTEAGKGFLRLMSRTHMDMEDAELCQAFATQFAEVKRRFVAALQRALPGLATAELFWRAHFMIGALLHTMNDTHRLRHLSDGLCNPDDVEGTLRRLVEFAAAGLQAKVTNHRRAHRPASSARAR